MTTWTVRARIVAAADGAPVGEELTIADEPFPIDDLGVAAVGDNELVVLWRRADQDTAVDPPTLIYRLLASRVHLTGP